MPRLASTRPAPRVLPDGTPLHNRLLLALPTHAYARIEGHLQMRAAVLGQTLHAAGAPMVDVLFPNGGVYSVTREMQDGTVIEVATVGREGMLGLGVALGDALAPGRTFLQVPNGDLPSLPTARFLKEMARGPFREIVALYTQAHVLQLMQSAACNALHDVRQRCCRWLLQTQDRVGTPEFLLKQEFLAVMLGVHRLSVTVVLGALKSEGLIATRYARIRVLKTQQLQAASCECSAVIDAHFARLGLAT